MASTNQSPEYQRAEKNFLEASGDEERLLLLEEMIRQAPKHKSSEKMVANLKTRYIKLKKKIETQKKVKRGSGKAGIKKEDMQAVLIGYTNSGKSAIINKLTNVNTKVSESPFTTIKSMVGMMNYHDVQVQIIEDPSIKGENFDIGIANSADLIIIVISKLDEIKEIIEQIPKAHGEKLIVFNKIDILGESEKRKISSYLSSKKYNYTMISCKTNEGLEKLKEKIFESFDIARIYLKEPGKSPTDRPLVMPPNSTIEDVAKKISREMAKNIKEVHIWGPSSKFPNQRVGLTHKVKDKDIVEFRTK